MFKYDDAVFKAGTGESQLRRQGQWTSAIFLTLLVSSLAFAQQNIRFRHLSIEQGLSQSSGSAIAQDDQGFMWFGTEDGVNRYNGYEMKIFRPERGKPTTLSNNWIYCILQDRQGKIWFGTDNGLNCFDRETEQFRRFMAQANNPDSLIGNRVYALMEDREGILWIGTDRGINCLSKDRTRMIRILNNEAGKDAAAGNFIRSIIQDKNGTIWIGTFGGGIRCLDSGSGKWTRFSSSTC